MPTTSSLLMTEARNTAWMAWRNAGTRRPPPTCVPPFTRNCGRLSAARRRRIGTPLRVLEVSRPFWRTFARSQLRSRCYAPLCLNRRDQPGPRRGVGTVCSTRLLGNRGPLGMEYAAAAVDARPVCGYLRTRRWERHLNRWLRQPGVQDRTTARSRAARELRGGTLSSNRPVPCAGHHANEGVFFLSVRSAGRGSGSRRNGYRPRPRVYRRAHAWRGDGHAHEHTERGPGATARAYSRAAERGRGLGPGQYPVQRLRHGREPVRPGGPATSRSRARACQGPARLRWLC